VSESLDPLGDQWEIRQLVERYAAAVDRGDGDAAAALFAAEADFEMWLEPGRDEPSAIRRGPAEVAAAINGLRGRYLTQHVIANSIADIDGDAATGETQCTAHHVRLGESGSRDEVMYLRYVEGFARIDGRWRFSHRELRVRWTAGHPVEAM
jgi:ketosteroid isomerase-like protein